MSGITYEDSGVDYKALDAFKRLAQHSARDTTGAIARFGFSELEQSRGESAYLIETPDAFLAHVEEGLGTKNLVADAMYRLTGKSYYDHIAQDTVAAIVNDMITLGALPLSVAMHLAVGDSNWFKDERRSHDLVGGWKKACGLARCAWGGGETPTLKGIVNPENAMLSGSAFGIVKPKSRLIRGNIQHGDAIIFLESSGVHANGLTLARKIADTLPNGYRTLCADGRTYGEALLDPTHIYVPFIEECLNRGITIRYAVNITGHGWRKLMRAQEAFTYIIEELPECPPVFRFMQENGAIENREMYGTFNMGAGFALYVPESEVKKVLAVAREENAYPFRVMRCGHIEQNREKKVVIRPKNLEYAEETLRVR